MQRKAAPYKLGLSLSLIFLLTGGQAPAAESMLESELADSYHYIDKYEILINAPAALIWPHLVDLGSWMNSFSMIHESGPVNGEGEILRLYEGEEFYLQIVKLIPQRMLVGVNLPSSIENEDSVGVVMITLAEFEEGTLASIFMSRQYDWPGPGDNPIKQRRETATFVEFNNTIYKGFLERLKELSEE